MSMKRPITPALNPATTEEAVASRGIAVPWDLAQGLLDLETALSEDTTLTPEGRVAKLAKAAEKKMPQGSAALDSAYETLTRQIQGERIKIGQTLSKPSPALQAEIRARVAGMSEDARDALVAADMKTGPKGGSPTLGSVAAGPAYLSGYSEEKVAMHKAMWAAEYCPEQVARIKELEAAQAHLRRAGTAFLNIVNPLIEAGQKIREAEQRRKDAEQG